jgi:hypothetical protein
MDAAWSDTVQSSSWAGPSPGQQLSCDAGTASTTGSAAVMIISSVAVYRVVIIFLLLMVSGSLLLLKPNTEALYCQGVF